MTTTKLTTTEVDRLEPGIHWDSDLKGFGVRVSPEPNLKRVFFANGRVRGSGKERRPTIGARPQWDAPRARKEAERLLRLMDQGIDPLEKARVERATPTMGDLRDRYFEEHHPRTAAGKEPGGMRDKDVRRRVDMIVKGLGGPGRKVASVHEGDARKLHADITRDNGPVRANRVKALASVMFNLALQIKAGDDAPWRTADLGNPFHHVKDNPEEGRERFYSRDEIARLARAYVNVEARRRDAGLSVDQIDSLRMMTYLGARPSEIFRATWSEFDAEPGLWVRPSSHLKQRKTHRVALNQPAGELIDRLRRARPDRQPTDLVFPGEGGRRRNRFNRVWQEICKEAGIPRNADGKWPRPYDLRHTVASIAGASGFSLPLIGAMLGHSVPQSTARYVHLADNAVREAADAVGRVIENAGNPAAEVVPLSPRTSRR